MFAFLAFRKYPDFSGKTAQIKERNLFSQPPPQQLNNKKQKQEQARFAAPLLFGIFVFDFILLPLAMISSFFSGGFGCYLNSGDFSDVILASLEGEEYHAHRLILAFSSAYFAKLLEPLSQPWQPAKQQKGNHKPLFCIFFVVVLDFLALVPLHPSSMSLAPLLALFLILCWLSYEKSPFFSFSLCAVSSMKSLSDGSKGKTGKKRSQSKKKAKNKAKEKYEEKEDKEKEKDTEKKKKVKSAEKKIKSKYGVLSGSGSVKVDKKVYKDKGKSNEKEAEEPDAKKGYPKYHSFHMLKDFKTFKSKEPSKEKIKENGKEDKRKEKRNEDQESEQRKEKTRGKRRESKEKGEASEEKRKSATEKNTIKQTEDEEGKMPQNGTCANSQPCNLILFPKV